MIATPPGASARRIGVSTLSAVLALVALCLWMSACAEIPPGVPDEAIRRNNLGVTRPTFIRRP